MYRQYDQEQDEDDVRAPQTGMYGQMPYEGTQQQYEPQVMPWQGMQGTPGMQGMPGMQGVQTQIGGRPMICYPMMYGNHMEQHESQEYPDMYRQQGMNYNRPRPYYNRPMPYYNRPRPYFNIYPFLQPYYYPYAPYNYNDDDDDDYGYRY